MRYGDIHSDETVQERKNLGSTAEVNSALRFLILKSKGQVQYKNLATA